MITKHVLQYHQLEYNKHFWIRQYLHMHRIECSHERCHHHHHSFCQTRTGHFPYGVWILNIWPIEYSANHGHQRQLIWGEGSVLKTFVCHCLAGHSQKLQKRTSPVTCDNKEWFIWMAFPIFSTEKIKLQAAIQDFFGWLEEVFFLVLKIVIPSLMNHSKGKKL